MMTAMASILVRAVQVLLFSATGLHAAEAGSSYTPIVGYDDKNGFLAGAAYFHYKEGQPGFNHGIYGVSNGRDFHSVTLDLHQKLESGLDLSLHSDQARTFDNYYGEGSQTSDKGGLRFAQDQVVSEAAALWHGQGAWAAGPTLGLKARREGTVTLREDGSTVPFRAFDDSATPALGLRAQYDTRDGELSSTRGSLWIFDARALPAKLAFLGPADDAWQGKAEWRNFQSLGQGFVWAHRLEGATSLGKPGYMQRYTLGGTDLLRGFQENRFRGDRFYCLQEELRIPLWRMISVATSVDMGEAGDGALLASRKSVQAGLRVGLPPDYGMKARLDFGAGDSGESSMALQFGQTF